MIEQTVPAVIALVTGGAVLFKGVHSRVTDLDKRIDRIELRIAESYVTKNEFVRGLQSMEGHMLRMDDKYTHPFPSSK